MAHAHIFRSLLYIHSLGVFSANVSFLASSALFQLPNLFSECWTIFRFIIKYCLSIRNHQNICNLHFSLVKNAIFQVKHILPSRNNQLFSLAAIKSVVHRCLKFVYLIEEPFKDSYICHAVQYIARPVCGQKQHSGVNLCKYVRWSNILIEYKLNGMLITHPL